MLNCPPFWKTTQSQFYAAHQKPLRETGYAIFAGLWLWTCKKIAWRTSIYGRSSCNGLKFAFKLVSAGGLENAFCSYQLKTNLRNHSDCIFGPTIGQWHKSPSNSPSTSHPGASGGFLVSCVELGMSGFQGGGWLSISNSAKNQVTCRKWHTNQRCRTTELMPRW